MLTRDVPGGSFCESRADGWVPSVKPEGDAWKNEPPCDALRGVHSCEPGIADIGAAFLIHAISSDASVYLDAYRKSAATSTLGKLVRWVRSSAAGSGGDATDGGVRAVVTSAAVVGVAVAGVAAAVYGYRSYRGGGVLVSGGDGEDAAQKERAPLLPQQQQEGKTTANNV